MPTQPEQLGFKFKFVHDGTAAGFFSTKASADANALTLGEEALQYQDVADTTTRDNRVVMVLHDGVAVGPTIAKYLTEDVLVVEIVSGAKALDVERFIDRQASHAEANAHQRQLTADGKGHLFRAVACPHCHATVDVSELDNTPYVYCRFCESVIQEGAVITPGDRYRVCDECHRFDRVRGYTEFYFYFLLVIYGWSYKRRHLCDNCVSRLFWKVLATNFIFLIGIPPAIWMKIRSMQGRDPNLGELATANKWATKGNMQQADPLFMRLHERYPEHPGLLYDQGHGYLRAGDVDAAMTYFDRSLRACSNYVPTAQTLQALKAVAQQQA